MKETVFVIGGCRSGKSRHALELAQQAQGRRYFVATCIPADEEMTERVSNHQRERGEGWRTVEAPHDICGAIRSVQRDAAVILVDCLTLWVSNLLLAEKGFSFVSSACRDLVETVSTAPCPVILVSNEVGAGIVPENKLARQFRDMTGHVNQQVAAAVDRVVWMVAGIPVPVKGEGIP